MAETREHPNLFELDCGKCSITYSTSSIDGQPQLTYNHDGESQTFRGDDLRREETYLGALVSVDLDYVPDLETKSLSILLPEINLPKGSTEAKFRGIVIHATHRTSIGGPRLVDGPIQIYDSCEICDGIARLVEF